jgi:DNA polymerase-3 subunit gamma/tau
VQLVLDPAHDTLLGDAQVQMIQRALDAHFGRSVPLLIEPGSIDVETPADRRARLLAERQEDAQQMLETDEQVQTLLSEFGGRLDEVQPLEGENTGADAGGSGRVEDELNDRQSGGAGR